MARRFLITGALPYANGRLHVGHIAGCYLPADIYVRYLRSRGDDVLFICGSDDHGIPITLAARTEEMAPAEVVKKYSALYKEDYDGLGIRFDIWSGTSSCPCHDDLSQHFFMKAFEAGYLEKRTTEQLYDAQAGMFLADRYVKGKCPYCDAENAYGDQCEACGRTIDASTLIDPVSAISGSTPELRKTTHWYMDLSRFGPRLKEWIGGHTEWRQVVRNFASGLLEVGLPARAMTRDLDWGIPVPLDDPEARDKVLYVWFDAPIGYISFTKELCARLTGNPEDYEQWWCDPDTKIIHFIGEDNIVFHALTWPAVLMAEGSYQLPAAVVANCFLNFQFPGREDTEKMSKSRGTAVWIHEYLKEFDPDPLRYYLTAIAPESQRTAFNFEHLARRNNDELVAAFGNLVHRALTFTNRYFDGKVPQAGALDEADKEQLALVRSLPERVAELMEAWRFKDGLAAIFEDVRASNRYLEVKQPWHQRKDDMAACGTTINVCLQTLRVLAVLVEPFLPFAAAKMQKLLGIPDEGMKWARATEELPAGQPVQKPEVLFKKLDLAELFGEAADA